MRTHHVFTRSTSGIRAPKRGSKTKYFQADPRFKTFAQGSAELHTDVRTYGHTDTHTDGHDTLGAPKQADLMRIRASKAVQKRHFSSTDFKLTFSKPGRHLDLRFGSRDPKCGILRGVYVATSGREVYPWTGPI